MTVGWFWLAAYLVAGVIGYLGHRVEALTPGGAVVACLVGGTVFGFGGLEGAVLLVLFFASSSGLSSFKVRDTRKRQAAETFEKGSRRDAAQVLANGGVAALAALLLDAAGGSNAAFFYGAFVGALAAATADTWATEIGVLSNVQPRLVTTGRVVPAGTSGGVTWLGSGAALLGAGAIGVAAALLSQTSLFGVPAQGILPVVAAGVIGGAAGMLADSLLGATLQASYWCPTCGKPTESRVHRCGTPTELRRGLERVNNDLVNVAGTVVGALAGGVILWI